jgi:beta-lactamase class A
MIAYSDNNATRLLHQKIDQETLMEVYRDLGIAIPETSGAVDFMTVNSYSYFFRILYNATYLTREYSEKAMEYLSEIDFPEGIAGGLPANTQTAKKFGERNIVFENSNQNYKELHDCGYVYYPGHPYLICIMTKGADFDKLAEVIKEISSRTYNWIDKQYITPESKTPK